MSKIAIKPHDSGSGVLTIETPNTDTDRTFNLPDASGTLLITGVTVATGDVAITGYLTVVDSNGNTVKLAIVA